jgi:ACR3 family arsenite efflux pump ArsB
LITRDTVCVDTPAAEATSFIVDRPDLRCTYIAPAVIVPVIVPVIDNIITKPRMRFKRRMSYEKYDNLQIIGVNNPMRLAIALLLQIFGAFSRTA